MTAWFTRLGEVRPVPTTAPSVRGEEEAALIPG
jgi:hypothetical protein